jgi:4'-phosphopantetheinyl transferase
VADLPATVWATPPAEVALPPGEVHVWRFAQDVPVARERRLAQVLSPDERERAARFRFERHRRWHVVARGTLRHLLARYVGAQPAALRFRYGPQGKPALEGPGAPHFNLAHSGGMALLAVARDRALGVDLEEIRPERADQALVERFFSPREGEMIRALPAALRPEAFFHCWTRKEAYIKAIGLGLSQPLRDFTVSVSPGEPAALLEVAGDPDATARWRLRALDPGPGFVGALAVEGPEVRLRCWTWRG